MSELVDTNMNNKSVDVILGKSSVVALVEILKQSLDSFRVLFGKIDVCFVLLLA